MRSIILPSLQIRGQNNTRRALPKRVTASRASHSMARKR
jgi:hypothetical protein